MAKKFSELDLWANPRPMCPHCGYEIVDAWDWDLRQEDWVEIDCPDCEEPFNVQMLVEVTYTTAPLDPPGPKETE
jgi:hypothetical protein